MRAWLLKIHEAARTQNFQGTFVISESNSVSSARIVHVIDGANQYERIESLDGPTRFVFRVNDVVQTMWPQSHVALIEQRDRIPTFPALLQAGDDHIADFYELRVVGSDRLAGREAKVLDVTPRDKWRFGYRLWSDQASGLLLRADTIDEQGRVVETSAFSDVSIGSKASFEPIVRAMKKLDGYKVVRPALATTKLDAEGWNVRQVTAGFRLVHCVRRPLQTAGIDPSASAPADPQTLSEANALQVIFSDGLTYVSIFIENFAAARRPDPTAHTIGATHTLTRRVDDAWITLVGDVPSVTLKAFADGLERRK